MKDKVGLDTADLMKLPWSLITGNRVEPKLLTTMIPQTKEDAMEYLNWFGKLLWCGIRILLVIVNNFYCIPTYVMWLLILSPINYFSAALYRDIEGILFHWLLSMVAMWSYSAGYDIVETGDLIDDIIRDETLVIANHQSTSDVPLMMAAFSARRGLLPNLNWIMDKLFKYTNFGIVSTFHSDFFICAGKDARESSIRELREYLRKTFVAYKRKWLVLFPEGGFLRKRREASQRFAEKNGLPKLEHVTIPRLGALQVIMETIGPLPTTTKATDAVDVPNNNMLFHPGTLRYIVDLTIAYPKGYPLGLVDVVTGYTSACRIYFHYRVFDIKEVPTDKDKMQDWLYKLYYEKEELLKNYYETGNWLKSVIQDKIAMANANGIAPTYRLVEQDLLRYFLLHTFFVCSTYFHTMLSISVVNGVYGWWCT